MDINELRRRINKVIDEAIAESAANEPREPGPDAHELHGTAEITPEPAKRVLPEGKRVVRTKSSGDRVYYIDEEKKTRQWITNPEVLEALGFEMGDVADVDDSELLKYNMSSALYRVEPDARA